MKLSQIRCYKSYCSEPLELIENYQQAKADNFAGWCIHHRRETPPDGTRVSVQELIDQGLYYGRPASELVFMKVGEHHSLHNKGNNHSEETRRKMSAALKGRTFSAEARLKMSAAKRGKNLSDETRKKISESNNGENNPMYGKHHSAETRKKMSEALKGRTLSAETCKKLSELHKCKLWWNDGISNKRSKECPGPEWKRGKLKKT